MVGLLGRPLSDAERCQLERWQRCEHKVKFIRARVILLCQSMSSAATVARAIGIHVQTVRDLVRTFHAKGLAGLEPKPRPGVPRRFAEAAEEALIALLHERPEAHGFDDGRWTLETAAQALARVLNVASVSTETVRRLLERRRYSWQRAKEWLDSPDPAYMFKKSGASA